MELAVKNIVSQFNAGVIFTGENSEGRVFRVRVKEPLFPAIGESYAVTGEFTDYRDGYGRYFTQIEVSTIERTATSGRLLAGYLMTLSNVGEARAKRLIDRFGNDIHHVLSDSEKLEAIGETLQPNRPGLGIKLAAHVQAEFIQKIVADKVQVEQFEFYARLEHLGVQDRGAAQKLWRILGTSKAGDALIANPYLAAVLLPWSAADSLGKAILRGAGVKHIANHPERLRGAVDAATRKLLSKGHSAATEAQWRKLAPKGVAGASMVAEGLSCGSLVREGDLVQPIGARYLEKDVETMLATIAARDQPHSTSQILEVLSRTEAAIEFDLTEEQRRAVGQIIARPLACLQGGAGVGKTTVMLAVTLAWEALGGDVLMAALAGKAALQLSRSTSRPGAPKLAVTIARLIHELRAVSDGHVSDHLPKLTSKTLLIIDEAAMVDTATLHELLSEIRKLQPDGCRLLLVGDSGQLPPVGFGAVFHQLVQMTDITSILKQPLRQAVGSSIPQVSEQIREGKVPDIPSYCNQAKGVHFVESNAESLVAKASEIYRHIRRSMCVEDVIVCAARNQTVDTFNKTMIAENWEDAKQLGLYARVYPGDPIICTKNHYSSGLFNGMLGVVRDIENDVMVSWEGGDNAYYTDGKVLKAVPPEVTVDIKLAYAITCHKSQGSSAKAVIVILEDTPLLTREWLYTAITRARTQVVIVGSKNALSMSIERRMKRVTGFNFSSAVGAGCCPTVLRTAMASDRSNYKGL